MTLTKGQRPVTRTLSMPLEMWEWLKCKRDRTNADPQNLHVSASSIIRSLIADAMAAEKALLPSDFD